MCVCVLEIEEHAQGGRHENGTKEEKEMERRVSANSKNPEKKTDADTEMQDGAARDPGSGTDDPGSGTDDPG